MRSGDVGKNASGQTKCMLLTHSLSEGQRSVDSLPPDVGIWGKYRHVVGRPSPYGIHLKLGGKGCFFMIFVLTEKNNECTVHKKCWAMGGSEEKTAPSSA